MAARRPQLRLTAALALLVFASFSPLVRSAPLRADEKPARSWSRVAAESWLERAEARLRRGDTAAAITSYTEAIRADPTLALAYFGLAEIRRLQGDYREAEWLLTRAVSVSEHRPEALTRRADLYALTGRREQALADLKTAADIEPSALRLKKLATAYAERRAWVAALALWRRIRFESTPDEHTDTREVDDTILALSVLAGETDAVQHDADERDWVRRALRRQAQR